MGRKEYGDGRTAAALAIGTPQADDAFMLCDDAL